MYSELHHENYQRLHDAARLAAQELRRQAIRAFWHQAARLAGQLIHAARHPVVRLPREA